jgi:hypothetical protein
MQIWYFRTSVDKSSRFYYLFTNMLATNLTSQAPNFTMVSCSRYLVALPSQYILIQEDTEILPEIPIPRKLILSKQRVWWLAIGSTGIVGLSSNSWVKNVQVSTRHTCDTHVRDIFSYTFP